VPRSFLLVYFADSQAQSDLQLYRGADQRRATRPALRREPLAIESGLVFMGNSRGAERRPDARARGRDVGSRLRRPGPLLAAIGLYGVIAFWRRAHSGNRAAHGDGADPSAVLSMVMRQAFDRRDRPRRGRLSRRRGVALRCTTSRRSMDRVWGWR
jgi:hypothetical protein